MDILCKPWHSSLMHPVGQTGGRELVRYKVMLLCNPLAALCFECHLWLASKL